MRGGLNPNRTLRLRGEANVARLALPPVANQNQKFPYLSIFGGGGVGGAAKKMKGNFMVLFPPLHSSKKDSYLYFSIVAIFCPSFLPSFASARRFLSEFCGSSVVRSHFANISHWPLASLTMPARCLLCVRSVASVTFVVALCACPTRPVRAK